MDNMPWLQPVCAIVLAIVLPFVIQYCKAKGEISGAAKFAIATVFSVLAGVATAAVGGFPDLSTAEGWGSLVSWLFAMIGGTQVAYASFKEIGFTADWLDALSGVEKPAE